MSLLMRGQADASLVVSDPCGVGVELLVFTPAAHAHSDVLDVADEFDALDPFDHFEAELGLKPEPQGAPCSTGSGAPFISRARRV